MRCDRHALRVIGKTRSGGFETLPSAQGENERRQDPATIATWRRRFQGLINTISGILKILSVFFILLFPFGSSAISSVFRVLKFEDCKHDLGELAHLAGVAADRDSQDYIVVILQKKIVARNTPLLSG